MFSNKLRGSVKRMITQNQVLRNPFSGRMRFRKGLHVIRNPSYSTPYRGAIAPKLSEMNKNTVGGYDSLPIWSKMGLSYDAWKKKNIKPSSVAENM